MWNFQERGKTKSEVLVALGSHPSALPRERAVEGVAVVLPPLCPAYVLRAIAAVVGELSDVPEGKELVVATHGDEATFNVNVALADVPAPAGKVADGAGSTEAAAALTA